MEGLKAITSTTNKLETELNKAKVLAKNIPRTNNPDSLNLLDKQIKVRPDQTKCFDFTKKNL
jgi:hypothetical protein